MFWILLCNNVAKNKWTIYWNLDLCWMDVWNWAIWKMNNIEFILCSTVIYVSLEINSIIYLGDNFQKKPRAISSWSRTLEIINLISLISCISLILKYFIFSFSSFYETLMENLPSYGAFLNILKFFRIYTQILQHFSIFAMNNFEQTTHNKMYQVCFIFNKTIKFLKTC